MQNYSQKVDIDHYSLQNISIISVTTCNNRILQHKNYSFSYLKVLVKPELSMHGSSDGTSKYFICFLTNISLRSERFTEQLFAMENKFLPRTVLR